MEKQIDIESALEDSIFELTEVEDMRDPEEHPVVLHVVEEAPRGA